MGSVADKIAKKIAAQGMSKVIDLAAWREGKEIAREAGLDDDRLAHLLSEDYDPCHALYIFGQNVAFILCEQISGIRLIPDRPTQQYLDAWRDAERPAILC